MVKRYNWAIISGDYELGVSYVNIVKRLSKLELANYIKNNVRKLFDHFLAIRRTDDDNKIKKIMDNIISRYGDLSDVTNIKIKMFNKIIEKINDKIYLLDDEEIVDLFNITSEHWYTRIDKIYIPSYKIVESSDFYGQFE